MIGTAGVFAQTNTVNTTKNIYTLKPFDGPLANPHKGFTVPTGGTWTFVPEFDYGPYGSLNNRAWDLITYGSGYQQWNKLNPAKGVYDWTDLDELLNVLAEHNKGYALRVLPYTPSHIKSNDTPTEEYDWTPTFVYEMGAGKILATLQGKGYLAQVPVWDDPIYIQAAKDFGTALAEKYDGDPRIEYIDIRSFGEWGEWHVSHLEGSEMPSLEIQQDIIEHYASVFKKTQLVLTSDGYGDIYTYALSLGITKRDDGFIGIPGTADSLVRAYNANLPTIAENIAGYTTMLDFNDIIPGGYLKWTPQRWVDAITSAHLTFYVLDQDSDCGYNFYRDNKALADSMSKVIGYNFRISNAELVTKTDTVATINTLKITVMNTGVAPCFFDIYMVAEFVDNSGTVLSKFGETISIPKKTFRDEMTKKFSFIYSVPEGQANIATQPEVSVALSLYESEEAYLNGKNPTVRFDNDGLHANNKLLLPSCSHEFGEWDTTKVATCTETGLRKRVCTQENCESYQEETISATGHVYHNHICSVCGEKQPIDTSSNVYYVAVDGNDGNDGSMENPFATLNKANAVVNAGDTVWIRGGIYNLSDTTYVKTYNISAGIHLTVSGESDDKRIHYLAYPGERPIFDGTNLLIGEGYDHYDGTIESVQYTSPIVVEAKYLHLKGFEVRNVPMIHNSNSGIYILYSKHIFLEQIDCHHNSGPGFFVNDGRANSGGHYFLNCDAHDNYDPYGRQGDGENADGFGVHYQQPGEGDTTRFYGCRAWWNSDDGFDVINQEFPVVMENCYAALNGYSDYGTKNPPNGNGYGIKMGQSTKGTGHHTITNCVAWKNKASGFYANYTSAGSRWINNTSYQNEDRAFNMASTTYDSEGRETAAVTVLTGDNAHVLKNNIAFPNNLSQIGECWVKSETVDEYVECAAGENNTWNLNLNLTESDFLSLDDPSMTITGEDLSTIAGALGPRKADGSLPNIDFLKLKAGSRAIDQGKDVGLPFAGNAPDLGAFEYSTVTQTITLQSGWNLISTNVDITNNTIESIFTGLNVEEIKNANGFWKKGQNTTFNSLKTITAGSGYLVKMNIAGTLTISGTPVQPTIQDISNGWNLIGCPYQTATPFTTHFNATNTQIIKSFDGYWMPNDTLSTLTNLVPGKGYYIKK